MRYVLRNGHEVYHYWATREQTHGRAGNCSFMGPKAFSYARCIAQIHINERGEKLVLFDTSGYNSVTTAKHIGFAHSAASHMDQVSVPNCDPRCAEDHNRNLDRLLRNIADFEGKEKRARKHKNIWSGMALRTMENYDKYAAFFDLGLRYNENSIAEMRERVRLAAEEAEKRRLEQEAQLRVRLAEALVKWRDGEDGPYSWGLYQLPEVALRLKGERVETTKGADIPVADAIKLWPIIERCRAGERAFEPGQPVGHYRLTKIRGDGSMVVGCHDIPYSEIEMIARQLGLKQNADSDSEKTLSA